MAEEKKPIDLVFELLNREIKERIDTISKTKKFEPEDIVMFCVHKINEEVGGLTKQVEAVRKNMVTKDDIKDMATKRDLGWIKWMIGGGFTIITVILSVVAYLLK